MPSILMKRRNFNIDMHVRGTPCEDEGRDRGDASISPGTPELASQPPEARDQPGAECPSQSSEGTNPAGTLISDF